MLQSPSGLRRPATPKRLLTGIALLCTMVFFGAYWQAVQAAPNNTATIEVRKVVVPGTLPENGTFDLLIDNTIEVSNCTSAGCSSTAHPVTGTSATIKEQAAVSPASSVPLSDYSTTIACYDRTVWNSGSPTGPAFATGTGTSLTIDQLGTTGRTDVVCVITNTRRTGQLWVKKEIIDAANPNNSATFDIQIDSISAPNSPFGHGQFSTKQTVNIGSHTVSEPVGADYNTSIRCVRVINNVITGIHVAGPQAGNSLAVNVDDGVNNDILCIVTNTRKVGKLEVIKKVVSPAGFTDTGKFDLQIDGITDPDANDIGNGGSTGVQTLAANVTYIVGENVDDPNTTATDYNSALNCYDRAVYNNGQPTGAPLVTQSSTSADVGDNLIIDENDDIVCEITNTRKTGKIQVVKDVVNDPPQSLGKFNLIIDDANGNNVTTAADQLDNGATMTMTVPTGDYTVSETAGTNTNLSKYSSTLSCISRPSNVTSTAATVTVAENERVVCTFTNTRLGGTLTLVKDFVPAALANDEFIFQVNGANVGTPFSADVPGTPTAMAAGAYTVGEVPNNANTALADYAISTICRNTATNTVVAQAPNAGPLSVFIDSNTNIVCTITNKAATIVIAKETNPANPSSPAAFDFTVTGPNLPQTGFQVTPGSSANTGPIVPGTYVYTETPIPSGWVLQDITCTGNTQSTVTKDLLNKKITINLVAGEDLLCTFKNVRKSIITLVKDASPDDGTDFMFSVNGHSHGPIDDAVPDDNDGHADTLSLANLLPGLYTINELLPPNWVQTGLTCDPKTIGGASGSGISLWNLTQNGVQINLAGNEEVICTFKNEKRGSITIEKAADPANGLDFTFTAPLALQPGRTFKLDDANPNDNDVVIDSQSFADLAPGSYTFTETVPSGWHAPTVNCTSDLNPHTANTAVTDGVTVNLDAGENVVCTFDNRIKRGGITVIKEAAPAEGTNFSFGGDLGTFVLDDGDADAIGGSKNFTNLLPGNYQITEQVPSDWNLTDVTCTGGNGNDTPITNGIQVTLDPDEQVVCTFRNVIKASGITIIKESWPNDPKNFPFSASSPLAPFTLDDASPDDNDGVADNQIFTNLLPGIYTIGEPVPLPTGWDVYDIECVGAVNSQVKIGSDADFDGGDSQVTIDLKPNEQVICTFTNAKRGSVQIIKEADPADGTDFPFSFTGSNILFSLNESVTLDDDTNATLSDRKTYFELPPGDYAIAENPPAGWSVTGRSCTGAVNSTVTYNADGKTTVIDLAPGENLVCTYENSKQGSITIVKDAFPEGTNQFAFNSTWGFFFLSDPDQDDYHFGDPLNGSSSREFTGLVPGTYNINELAQGNGWAVTHIECEGGADVLVGSDHDFDLGDIGVTIDLGAGEDVICEFANQFTSVSTLTLQKTVDPTSYNTVGQQLTYSFVIKNSGNTPLTGVLIQEGLVGVNISCPGFNGQLAAGQQTTCTGTYSVQQSDLDRGFIQNSAFAKAEGNITSVPASVVATAVQTPKINLVKSVTDNNGGDVVLGDVLTYKFEATNSGNVTLSGVKVIDPLPGLGSLSCTPAQPTTLAPGSKLTCTASYTVQQADVNTGLIQNTATAEGTDPGNVKRTAQHTATVTVKRNLSLNLKKSFKSNADEDGSGSISLNDTLTYEFVVTNNSTVSVSNVKVVDPLTGLNGVCGATNLAVGASTSCTSTYKVKQSDVDRGQIVNIALASATDANNAQLTAPASATVNLQQKASIALEKSVTNNDVDQSGGVNANDILTYQFKVTNDGNVTLTSVGVSDPAAGLSALNCTPTQPSTLTPGQSMTCSATYQVTAADVTAGKIKNTATATGIDAITGPVASTDQVSISTQQLLRLGLLKRIAQVTVNQDKSIGIVVEYTLQNQGNSPLTNLALFDNVAGDFANLAPQGFTAANGSMAANSGWNGQGSSNVLAPFQSLGVGDQGTVYVGFKVTTNQPVQVQTNAQANAQGTQGDGVSESTTVTIDLVSGQNQQPAGATVNGPNSSVSNGNVIVGWTTQAETRISGFRLYRSTDGTRANAQPLGVILSHGVAAGSSYSFIDSAVQPNTTYTYWLVVVADGVEIAEYGPASVTTPAGNPTQPTARSLYIPLAFKK